MHSPSGRVVVATRTVYRYVHDCYLLVISRKEEKKRYHPHVVPVECIPLFLTNPKPYHMFPYLV